MLRDTAPPTGAHGHAGWALLHSTDDTSGSLDDALRIVDGWRADRLPHRSDIRCRKHTTTTAVEIRTIDK